MKKILSIMLCVALLLAVAALAIGCTDKDKETDPTEPVSTEQNGDNTESDDATESDAQETESGDVYTTEASETDVGVVVGEGDEVGVIGDD
ncbi:MAG: hypothetical protein IKX58_06435 [Clostridia bacterium]|nr:hypothetical protein [Clostridia bacterium]